MNIPDKNVENTNIPKKGISENNPIIEEVKNLNNERMVFADSLADGLIANAEVSTVNSARENNEYIPDYDKLMNDIKASIDKTGKVEKIFILDNKISYYVVFSKVSGTYIADVDAYRKGKFHHEVSKGDDINDFFIFAKEEKLKLPVSND